MPHDRRIKKFVDKKLRFVYTVIIHGDFLLTPCAAQSGQGVSISGDQAAVLNVARVTIEPQQYVPNPESIQDIGVQNDDKPVRDMLQKASNS